MAQRQNNRTIAERIYSWLLKAYPAKFRQEYGAQMLQLFHDGSLEAEQQDGIKGLLGWWLCSLADMVRSIAAQWAICANKSSWSRQLSLMSGVGVISGVLIHVGRDSSVIKVDFLKLEFICMLLALVYLTFIAHKSNPLQLGLLAALFLLTSFVAHFACYPLDGVFSDQRSRIFTNFDYYNNMLIPFVLNVRDWTTSAVVSGFVMGMVWGGVISTIMKLRRPRTTG